MKKLTWTLFILACCGFLTAASPKTSQPTGKPAKQKTSNAGRSKQAVYLKIVKKDEKTLRQMDELMGIAGNPQFAHSRFYKNPTNAKCYRKWLRVAKQGKHPMQKLNCGNAKKNTTGAIALVQSGKGVVKVSGPSSATFSSRHFDMRKAKVGTYQLQITPPKGYVVVHVADQRGIGLLPPYRQTLKPYTFIRYHVSYEKKPTYMQLQKRAQQLQRKVNQLQYILKRMTNMSKRDLSTWKEALQNK